jgi:hypothetical protein
VARRRESPTPAFESSDALRSRAQLGGFFETAAGRRLSEPLSIAAFAGFVEGPDRVHGPGRPRHCFSAGGHEMMESCLS